MIAYQIPCVIVVFVILVFKVWFVSLYSQKPQEVLNLLVTEERYWALFYMPLYTCIDAFTQFAECTSTDFK
jgi:Na+-driven multidrug efflux pump